MDSDGKLNNYIGPVLTSESEDRTKNRNVGDNKDNRHRSDEKMEEDKDSVRDQIDTVPSNINIAEAETETQCNVEDHKAGVQVLESIIEKFRSSCNMTEKLKLLTLAPSSWSIEETMSMFGASEKCVRAARKLVSEHGIFSDPIPNKRKPVSPEIQNLVKEFYQQEDISILLAGEKDFLSVLKNDGTRERIQKRLMFCNLNELFCLFKSSHEEVDISLTKFAKLRPAHCVLPGASGTHALSVCVHHENVDLMLENIDIQSSGDDSEIVLKNYRDYINLLICSEPTPECYLGDCENCPDESRIKNILIKYFNDNEINEVTFNIWTQMDRCHLITTVMNSYWFVFNLCHKLKELKCHDFIANQQLSFVNDKLKKSLESGEFIVSCDFVEDYAEIVQNSDQSIHWNNNQASIFAVVIYYREFEELKHKRIAIISDYLSHDTVAVYVCQKIIIEYLKRNFNLKKVYYFTDSVDEYFKNKNNIANLVEHKSDFDVLAEWHFHAIHHGREVCDLIGANIKRNAILYSLQCSKENRIMNAKELFEWTKKYFKETITFYSDKKEYSKAAKFLKSRFDNARDIFAE